AVNPEIERDAPLPGLVLVVDPDHRGEAGRAPFEIDDDLAVGLERKAVRVLDAAEIELERSRWRLPALTARTPERCPGQVEAVDPDAVRRRIGSAKHLRILRGVRETQGR